MEQAVQTVGPMHATLEQLEASMGHVRAAPTDRGILETIVIRP